ncbi:hypothetical protein [Flavobacterium sp. WV_118_3]|jgi:hypothetical protein|uniref:hypothetical protein n=1 Tax=Flavobacterium sp. WV_118_3 TaxID=3151764 RepID=UPI002C496AAF|nr:hypothetical protein [Flavobacterium sp.]
MKEQEILLKAIRKQLSDHTSLISELASVLNISYDAAHRRISQKSKFTIEETVTLCGHYKISMDKLFFQDQKVIVEKTREIHSMTDMIAYFKHSSEKLQLFKSLSETKMYYSAKDIPLFYTADGTLLSKFKLYVWMNLLNGDQNQESFEKFSIDGQLSEYTQTLKKVYESVEVHEIWNDTTINSTLQQILYFFEAGLVNLQNAIALYDDLKAIIQKAEEKCVQDPRYNIYYNELLILNNNVLVTDPKKQALFIPYTMLGYFITDDQETCSGTLRFFLNQLKNSKSLNVSGTKDRKQFFNKSLHKIDFYIERLKNEITIDF